MKYKKSIISLLIAITLFVAYFFVSNVFFDSKISYDQCEPSEFIYEAIRDGNLDRIKYGLDRGYKADYENWGGTRLGQVFGTFRIKRWWRPWYGWKKKQEKLNFQIIKVLLEHGEDVNIVDTIFGMAPIHYVIAGGVFHILHSHLEYLDLLFQYGADPNLKTQDGNTPLHLAVMSHKKPDILKYLIEHGARVNALNAEGNTPLHVAIRNNVTLDNMNALLEHGADVNIRNNEGKTPLQLALERRENNKDNAKSLKCEDEMIALLKEYGAQ